MTVISIDLDGDLLAEASVALHTRHPSRQHQDTVTEALRWVAHGGREPRRRALVDLQRIADEGGFHFDQIDELDQ